jgi:hypothetical protein
LGGNKFGHHPKLTTLGVVTWEKDKDKSLLYAKCATCGKTGMAYSDPQSPIRPHYCYLHLKGENIG